MFGRHKGNFHSLPNYPAASLTCCHSTHFRKPFSRQLLPFLSPIKGQPVKSQVPPVIMLKPLSLLLYSNALLLHCILLKTELNITIKNETFFFLVQTEINVFTPKRTFH